MYLSVEKHEEEIPELIPEVEASDAEGNVVVNINVVESGAQVSGDVNATTIARALAGNLVLSQVGVVHISKLIIKLKGETIPEDLLYQAREKLVQINIKQNKAKLADVFRDYYQTKSQSTLPRLFDKGETSLAECYINLSIIQKVAPKLEKEQLEKANKLEKEASSEDKPKADGSSIHDARLHTYESLHNVKHTETITPAELFKPIERKPATDAPKQRRTADEPNKPIHRLLVLGRAGIGKSTLCRYLCHQWATDAPWQNDPVNQFTAVIGISLRELAGYAKQIRARGNTPTLGDFVWNGLDSNR